MRRAEEALHSLAMPLLGEVVADSDVDLLVDMEEGRSLLDLVGLTQELETLLGCRVDVLTDGGVSPYLRERIYAEAVPL